MESYSVDMRPTVLLIDGAHALRSIVQVIRWISSSKITS